MYCVNIIFLKKSLSEVKAALGNAVTYLMRQCLPSTVADHELEPYIEEFKLTMENI